MTPRAGILRTFSSFTTYFWRHIETPGVPGRGLPNASKGDLYDASYWQQEVLGTG